MTVSGGDVFRPQRGASVSDQSSNQSPTNGPHEGKQHRTRRQWTDLVEELLNELQRHDASRGHLQMVAREAVEALALG